MKLSFASLVLSLGLAANVSAQTISNYQYVVSSQGPTAYFKLDGSLESAVNSSVVLQPTPLITTNGGFAADMFRNTTNSYAFAASQNNASLNYLSGPLINGGGQANSNATAKGSVAFLFRALSGLNIGGQRFLFDATTTASMGTTNHNAFSVFFENDTSTNNPNTLKLRFGDSTYILLKSNDIQFSAWYHFALTYDEARVPNKAIWYLQPVGGLLSTGTTTNNGDAVAGEGTGLYIGNRAGYGGAFRNPGSGRIDEFAIWDRELSATEISNQFAALPQLTGTYEQVTEALVPKYYFKLNNSLVESVGNSLNLSTNGDGGAFTTDFFGNANSAYAFSHTNDALYITNDLIAGGGPGTNDSAGGVGTISFLFRMLSDTNYTGQRFIFSAPGEEDYGTNDNQLALYLESSTSTNPWPGSLKLRVGNLTKGSTNSSTPENNVPVAYATNLVPNAWYYFAMTYDESRNTSEVSLYFGQVGGTLKTDIANPANNSVVGNNGWLALGNKLENFAIGDNAFRNPGQGAIDEFAIWHDELGASEIAAQFNALILHPVLSIATEGSKAILSWPNTTPANFILEAAPALVGQTWTNAGSPTTIGSTFFVTNNLSPGASFFRLHKQ